MTRLTPKAFLALAAVYVIWGSTYLAIRVGVETIPPLLMAAARFIPAGAIMYVLFARGRRASAREWRAAAIVGAGLCLGGNGLVSVAEQRVESGTAALIIATVPLWIAFFERAVYKARLPLVGVAGLFVGFTGVALLMLPGGAEGGTDTGGALLLVCASGFWAAASLYARRAPLPDNALQATAMEMLAGGGALLLAGTIVGEWGRLDLGGISRSSLTGLVYLILFGSLVAFTSYAWLLKNVKISIVATYAFVNPLVAVLLGVVFADERFTPLMLGAGALIVVAVATIVLSSGGTPRSKGEVGPEDRPDLSSEQMPA